MARKTFISYKHSEAQSTRDAIVKALGDDATYYQGETSDSPDLNDTSTENIKKVLRDMMYDTSVTIVVVSPNFRQSDWIDWEIEYCLKEMTRKNRTSRSNGVLGVIQAVNGGYDWLVKRVTKLDGCTVRQIDESPLYRIVKENRYNRRVADLACETCNTYDQLLGSYISLIDEVNFMANPEKYIESMLVRFATVDLLPASVLAAPAVRCAAPCRPRTGADEASSHRLMAEIPHELPAGALRAAGFGRVPWRTGPA